MGQIIECCICGKRYCGEGWPPGFLFSADNSHRWYCKSEQCIKAYKDLKKKESEEHRKELQAKWYQDNKEEIRERQKQYREQNRQTRNEANRRYTKTHREEINQHISYRKKTDLIFKLKCQARNAIYQSFARTGNVKKERCEKIVGLQGEELVSYLKKTFRDVYGREWDGKEKVHIDHIIPLATAFTEEDVIRLCNYSNLRLITAEDNLKKGATINYEI